MKGRRCSEKGNAKGEEEKLYFFSAGSGRGGHQIAQQDKEGHIRPDECYEEDLSAEGFRASELGQDGVEIQPLTPNFRVVLPHLANICPIEGNYLKK